MGRFLHAKNMDTLIAECNHLEYEKCQPVLTVIAELIQSFATIHVYKICETSLWQASALGYTPRYVLEFLREASYTPIPFTMQQFIATGMTRWGQLSVEPEQESDARIALTGPANVLHLLRNDKKIMKIAIQDKQDRLIFPASERAWLKRQLVLAGHPAIDKLGFVFTKPISMRLNPEVVLRPYQEQAVTRFLNPDGNGNGVIVLPCGSGKTLVGIAVLARIQMHTLIVVPNDMTAKQWRDEILANTNIASSQVQLYSVPQTIAPITIVTYQKVTAKSRAGEFKHLNALVQHIWGLTIYDEVHLLPAPLFRLAAQLQSSRRLGLTATLVREDGHEKDVFSMIGPKCFEKPWKALERDGYIARVQCVEIRISLPAADMEQYGTVNARTKYRIAADNKNKLKVISDLCLYHNNASILIMGHYIEFLYELSRYIGCPFMHGNTSKNERNKTLQQFRDKKLKTIILSRIANMGIDLPCASIAIQTSGLFGSRQEEAQRLGRILRPATSSGVFYTLITSHTVEERLAKHRQMYLAEQGYTYSIVDAVNLDKERIEQHETV